MKFEKRIISQANNIRFKTWITKSKQQKSCKDNYSRVAVSDSKTFRLKKILLVLFLIISEGCINWNQTELF